MTNEQIIKALECCKTDNVKACDDCPYNEKETKTYCVNDLIKDVLGLIIRQQKELEAKHAHILCLYKEVERLTGILSSYALQYGTVKSQSEKIKEIKFEAITGYHEEVKKRCIEGGIYPAFVNRQMEDVRKEMVGESK